jgi:hypothetical protein
MHTNKNASYFLTITSDNINICVEETPLDLSSSWEKSPGNVYTVTIAIGEHVSVNSKFFN